MQQDFRRRNLAQQGDVSADGQRREDQDRLIRMPVHLVRPSQLHERFAEAAVSKDSRAPLS